MSIRNKIKSRVDSRRATETRFLIETTEALVDAVEHSGMKKIEIAEKLEMTKGRISQFLNGNKNLTLRSLAAICWAIGKKCKVVVEDDLVCGESDSAPQIILFDPDGLADANVGQEWDYTRIECTEKLAEA